MWKRFVAVALMVGLAAGPGFARKAGGGSPDKPPPPLIVEQGRYLVFLQLQRAGAEDYTVAEGTGGSLVLTTVESSLDGRVEPQRSVLTMRSDFSPISLEAGGAAPIEAGRQPGVFFLGLRPMPVTVEMMMMRSWRFHGQPARLPVLLEGGQTVDVQIRLAGHDAFLSHGRMVRLARYTVTSLVFGREVLWMNDSYRLAAVLTFSGGGQEIVLDEYARALGELVHSGVSQEMLDLADLSREVPAEAQGAYAIVGARLIDGTGAEPVEHSTVVIRGGRIAAAGPSSEVKIPRGMRVIHAEGESVLPGLWNLDAPYTGVEAGPALLAAGITSARVCGGEREFLQNARQAIERGGAPSPRLLLAGGGDGEAPEACEGGKEEGSPGGGVEAEMEREEAQGMSAMEAIQSATLGAARQMGLDGDSGSVTVGKRADLVLVEGNPLTDPGVLRGVVKVVTDGRMYAAAKLRRSVGLPH